MPGLGRLGVKRALGTGLLGGGQQYWQRIKSIFGASVIQILPLKVDALDKSGNGRNGAATAVTYDGTGATLDGLTSYINIYSAGLAAAFSGLEGSAMMWAKVSGAGVWADGSLDWLILLKCDANNYISLYKNTAANQIVMDAIMGGTLKSRNVATSSTDWMHLAITWSDSNDRMGVYYNGALVTGLLSPIGTWVGALAVGQVLIGASPTAGRVWNGKLTDWVLLNKEASAAQIAQVYALNP